MARSHFLHKMSNFKSPIYPQRNPVGVSDRHRDPLV